MNGKLGKLGLRMHAYMLFDLKQYFMVQEGSFLKVVANEVTLLLLKI